MEYTNYNGALTQLVTRHYDREVDAWISRVLEIPWLVARSLTASNLRHEDKCLSVWMVVQYILGTQVANILARSTCSHRMCDAVRVYN